MKFTFITVSAPSVKCLMKAAREVQKLEPELLDLRLYYAVTDYGKDRAAHLRYKDIRYGFR